MNFCQRFWKSSIGAKLTMAVTGILLFGFVVGHLTGNLLVFQGRDAMNDYSEFLHSKPALLWVVRLGLLAVVGVHIVTAARLTRENQAARPVPYACKENLVSSAASRSMMLTGVGIVLYVLFHLAHLTWGLVMHDHYGRMDDQGRLDVFFMVTEGFRVPWLSLIYLLAMGVLGLHLMHGISSFFQTLGVNHPRYNCCLRLAGPVIAAVIVVGYISIPVAVLAGWIGEGAAS